MLKEKTFPGQTEPPKGKSVHALLTDLAKSNQDIQIQSSVSKEAPKMKLKSNRYKGTDVSIGNTLFKFDKDGVCEITDTGFAGHDVEFAINRGLLDWFVEEAPKVIPEEVIVAPDPVVLETKTEELKKNIDEVSVKVEDTVISIEVPKEEPVEAEPVAKVNKVRVKKDKV